MRMHRRRTVRVPAPQVNAVVLCGGLGTRLGELTRETPKPLLEVGGKPLVAHVLEKLQAGGVTQACLAVSFQWQKLKYALGDSWNGLQLTYSVESEPMGTGGAVRQALQQMGWAEAFVANGDTLIDVDLGGMRNVATTNQADWVIALKLVDDAARFGRVNIGTGLRVTSFSEKGLPGPGLINAGLYWLRARVLEQAPLGVFSLERDLMAVSVSELAMYGFVTSGYFIDMGIPEDLERARRDLC